MGRVRTWLIFIGAILAALLLAGRLATTMAVELAWFESLGVPQLFREEAVDRVLLQGGAFAAGSLLAFLNLYAVRRTIAAVAMQSRVANLELVAVVPSRKLLSATIAASLVLGAILALPMSDWTSVALVRHGVPFGEIEGVTGRDIGFYVYWLPFEEMLYLWSLVAVVSMTAIVLVLYALTRSLRLDGSRLSASTHVRRHLSALAAVILLLLAWSYRLDAFDLLQFGSGPDGVFLRIDHRVVLRMDWLLSGLCALTAVVVLRTGWIGQLRAALVAVGAVLIAAVSLRHIVPAVVSRTDILGEASVRDRDYFTMRAVFSRRAFDVDGIEFGDERAHLGANPTVPIETLASRASLWDENMLRRWLAARPSLALPGAGGNVDGRQSDIGTADRRGDSRGSIWTIGWGDYGGRSSALIIQKPFLDGERWRVSTADVTRPELHDSVLTTANLGPHSDERYWPVVGPGIASPALLDSERFPDVKGVALGSRWRRIAHAWALREPGLLGANIKDSSTRVVAHRDVRDRLDRLAPIFVQGREVYPIIAGGGLHWAVHLYSASDRYPLSMRWQAGGEVLSYFRLAATALINASTGDVRLVSVATPDAIAQTWMKLLPDLFVPADEIPSELVSRLPPPTDGAAAQIRTFVRFGTRQSSSLRYLQDSALAFSALAPVLLSDSAHTVVALTVPVMNAKDAVDGIFSVGGGKDRVLQYSDVPAQFEPFDSTSRRLSRALKDTSSGHAVESGSDAIGGHGNSRTRMFLTSFGLIEEQIRTGNASDGRVSVERIALSSDGRVTSGISLSEALARLGISGQPVGPKGAVPENQRSGPADLVRRLYDEMRRALQRGDWARFGAAFDSLGAALGRTPP